MKPGFGEGKLKSPYKALTMLKIDAEGNLLKRGKHS